MESEIDVAIVGAGILGLAHAYHFARAGMRVTVFERSPRAQGASVRNFGMIWPIGQPAGERYSIAMRSRAIWLEVLQASGIWHEQTGSLHLAYREDEEQVLREFSEVAPAAGYDCALISPDAVASKSPAVKVEGLRCALWSPTEVCVDPREVIRLLPGWLNATYGVQFRFSTVVTGYNDGAVTAGGERVAAKRLVVCCGDDLRTLYPEVLAASGIFPCKLQMMRTAPAENGWRIGPMLAAGLTLRHYLAFQSCPSLAVLKERVARETPEFDRYGIHVMASQNGSGEIVLGDSHEYGEEITLFDKQEIERLILDYLGTFMQIPQLSIGSRWHGVYGKHPNRLYFTASPEPGVSIVTGIGGAGMTLSFGVAERTSVAIQENISL
jgi:FAD dependent oxidoreductase TIGR03364